MNSIIIATTNKGKLREIKELFQGSGLELSALSDHFNPVPDIPEDKETFLGNARQKAEWVRSRTGMWTLADDSVLEVDFLDGDPGVRSARYAGVGATDSQRIEKLLSACEDCPEELRTARFKCAVIIKLSEQEELIGEGVCEGRIGFAPQGSGGFGYDPVFFPQGFDRSFAELSAEEKNAISHRGKALAALRRRCDERFTNEQ